MVKDIAHQELGVSSLAKSFLDQIGEETWVHSVNYTESTAMPASSKIVLDQNKVLTVYPSPTSSIFTVNINLIEELKNSSIEIVNVTGRFFYKQILKDGETMLRLDAKTMVMSNGVYLVSLKANGKVISTCKLAIQN